MRKFKKLLFKKLEKITGLGYCPNCGVNFIFKKNLETIWYEMIGTPPNAGYKGISICKKCFNNKKKLDPDRIYKSCISSGWNSDTSKLVYEAVCKITGKSIIRINKLKKINKIWEEYSE